MNSVTEYLDQIVEMYPDKIAYSDIRRDISFLKLQNESWHISYELISRGIRKKPIIILMDKSIEEIASFIGVAYSGNFYTPIDVHMPFSRMQKIFDSLQPAAIVTNKEYVSVVSNITTSGELILYEEAQTIPINLEYIYHSAQQIIDTDLLYVLFTSGSTGVPKGVTISHRAVINYTDWITELVGITSDDILGNEAPLHFDLSIQDVYAPLKIGCKTVLIEMKYFTFPGKLMKLMYEKKITTIFWVPSALCAVADLRGLRSKVLPPLSHIAFCGEVMPCKQLNMWREVFEAADFFNLYGPTEACDACAYFKIDRPFSDDEALPIGFPAKNTDVFLLDENNQRIEVSDCVGEICIRGTALSYGYYNDVEKTNAVFIQNPLSSTYSEIVYHTGDLGRFNDRMELMFVSRKDFQIKHMGHRIELEEIEIAASSFVGVERTGCLYDEDKKQIVLFYTGYAQRQEVFETIRSKLPGYMIPARIICLSAMPINSNGKLDKNMLRNSYVLGVYDNE